MTAIGLVLLAFAVTGVFIVRPTKKAGSIEFPKESDGEVPEELQGVMRSITLGTRIDSVLLLVVLLMMIVASNGGF